MSTCDEGEGLDMLCRAMVLCSAAVHTLIEIKIAFLKNTDS